MHVLKKFGLRTDKSERCVSKEPFSLLFSPGNITSVFLSVSVTVFTGILIDKFKCILYFLVYSDRSGILHIRSGILHIRSGILHIRSGILHIRSGILHICFNWFFVMFISKMEKNPLKTA